MTILCLTGSGRFTPIFHSSNQESELVKYIKDMESKAMRRGGGLDHIDLRRTNIGRS